MTYFRTIKNLTVHRWISLQQTYLIDFLMLNFAYYTRDSQEY